MKKVHFISIGGSIMHSLAIALKNRGYKVTGSDNEIYDPSKSKLEENDLLPEPGWFPEKISADLDAVIVGMHAQPGNEELERAKELGINIYSFPDYIYEESLNKQRIVIAGSHGKTTITAMIIHVLKYAKKEFDYLVGAEINGIDNLVKLNDAPIIIIEGDEYFCSPVDKTPKFLRYKHHMALLSGIAWDHINAYPTFDEYVHQFDEFTDATPKAGSIVFCGDDNLATMLGTKERPDVNRLEYTTHPYVIKDGDTYLKTATGDVKIKVFGKHNLQNIAGALTLLKRIGITEEVFYKAIQSFEGAKKRLQKLGENGNSAVFIDYAHAPSKVAATTSAIKEQFPKRELLACLELHTYSSLNRDFIGQYAETLSGADKAIIYINPNNLKLKDGQQVDESEVSAAFSHDNLTVTTDINFLKSQLESETWDNKNLLMMSSGHFANLDITKITDKVLN